MSRPVWQLVSKISVSFPRGVPNAATAVSALSPLRCHAPFLYLKMIATVVQELLSNCTTKASD